MGLLPGHAHAQVHALGGRARHVRGRVIVADVRI